MPASPCVGTRTAARLAADVLGRPTLLAARTDGYTATKHQRKLGTFDRIRDVIMGSRASARAMAGSTEVAPFH